MQCNCFSRHIKQIHEKIRFKCDHCNETFSAKSSLKLHLQAKHSENEAKHKCDRCNKIFALPFYLKRHIQYSHENPPKKHKCEMCNKEFVYLKRHIKTCLRSIHGEKNLDKMFPCKLCHERFVYRDNLMLHIKVVHKKEKKKYICEICKVEFNSSSNLCEHRKARHTEATWEKCKLCDRELKAGPSMTQHVLNHSKDRVNCNICNK